MTAFSPVSWSPTEIITDEKMQQLADNINWVYENTPRATYTNNIGHVKNAGIRMASGMAVFAPGYYSNGAPSVAVSFGNAFSVGCYPVITTGLNSLQGGFPTAIWAMNGSLQPDHTGFMVTVQTLNFANWVVVPWIALGY